MGLCLCLLCQWMSLHHSFVRTFSPPVIDALTHVFGPESNDWLNKNSSVPGANEWDASIKEFNLCETDVGEQRLP